MILAVVIYFFLGAITGLLSGLLGIGGGIIVVPALVYVFYKQHIPEVFIMHLAVGTSLAVMVLTTLRSLRSHLAYQGQSEFWLLARLMLPTVIVGVIVGGLSADVMHSKSLQVIFGCVLLIVSVRLLFFVEKESTRQRMPSLRSLSIAGMVVGFFSGLIGIGGGTIVVPYLLYYQTPMRVAVRVAVFVGLIVAIVGVITYLITGFGTSLPPHCWGYIYWPAWFGVSLGSVLCAPLGVQLSYHLPSRMLKRIFAVLTVLIAVHMLYLNL